MLVASVGDVDGDGITDHALTDANPFAGRTGPGRVWIFAGRDGHVLGKLEGEEARPSSNDPGRGPAMFGSAFARLGDVDGDGRADFLVAAWAGARAFRTDPARLRPSRPGA